MIIPESLKWLEKEKEGRHWLSSLPQLLRDVCDLWEVSAADQPLTGGNVSYVTVVTHNNTGDRYILKLQWPHPECEHEAQALREWNGNGAVRLIAHNAERYALLLEACEPATFLADAECDPVDIFTEMLPKLWIDTKHPFQTLEQEARKWLVLLQKKRLEALPDTLDLVDCALELGAGPLLMEQGPQVLLHQDLHGHNVLSAQREEWLAIDPKPILGEREFALSPILRSFEFGHTKASTLSRLNGLCQNLNLNRERAIAWTILQTMAWSFNSAYRDINHQTVRWLMTEL